MPSLPQGTLPIGTDQTDGDNLPTIGLSFNLPEALPYIPYLRRATCQLFKEVGVSDDDISDLETIIGELATNAVRHAKGGNYHVEIGYRDLHATITVSDNGAGFDPNSVPESGTLRLDELSEGDDLRIGGFGLSLVHSLADEVRIERKEPKGMMIHITKTVTLLSRQEQAKSHHHGDE